MVKQMATTIKAKYVWLDGTYTIVNVDLNQKVSKYFTVGEVANQSAKDDIKYVSTPRHRKFLHMMDEMREEFGPIAPSSCFRTKSFNDALPGADKNSCHLRGEAMDNPINTVTNQMRTARRKKWEYLCIKYREIGAINFYTRGFHYEIGSDISYGAMGFQVRDYRGTPDDWK